MNLRGFTPESSVILLPGEVVRNQHGLIFVLKTTFCCVTASSHDPLGSCRRQRVWSRRHTVPSTAMLLVIFVSFWLFCHSSEGHLRWDVPSWKLSVGPQTGPHHHHHQHHHGDFIFRTTTKILGNTPKHGKPLAPPPARAPCLRGGRPWNPTLCGVLKRQMSRNSEHLNRSDLQTGSLKGDGGAADARAATQRPAQALAAAAAAGRGTGVRGENHKDGQHRSFSSNSRFTSLIF